MNSNRCRSESAVFFLFQPISTARLELVAITPESVLSEQAGDGRLGEILVAGLQRSGRWRIGSHMCWCGC